MASSRPSWAAAVRGTEIGSLGHQRPSAGVGAGVGTCFAFYPCRRFLQQLPSQRRFQTEADQAWDPPVKHRLEILGSGTALTLLSLQMALRRVPCPLTEAGRPGGPQDGNSSLANYPGSDAFPRIPLKTLRPARIWQTHSC